MIGLDECTQLDALGYDHTDMASQRSMSLIALERMILTLDGFDEGISSRCWFLLLDTDSHAPVLHPPPGPTVPSLRLARDRQPLTIWPYFDLDLMVEAEFTRKKPTPGDALYVDHLKCYGRPVMLLFLFIKAHITDSHTYSTGHLFHLTH